MAAIVLTVLAGLLTAHRRSIAGIESCDGRPHLCRV
jgi:hypothetical protein